MNYLLIVANACDEYGAPINAITECRRRLDSEKWVLFKNTPHRLKMATNDRLLFYCSDPRAGGQVIASARIANNRPPHNYETNLIASGTAETILDLNYIEKFDDPISFRSILPSLSFAPKNMQKWGNVVFGGCRTILDKDFDLIKNAPDTHRLSSIPAKVRKKRRKVE